MSSWRFIRKLKLIKFKLLQLLDDIESLIRANLR